MHDSIELTLLWGTKIKATGRLPCVLGFLIGVGILLVARF
ncbi:hypothetical protein EDE08_103124 [Bradyrhizobium sp. R2.2-H]|jgi:hypothetical protein|nr:hypothetical protein EDE10_103123 [Bradyrhizobium sp. Y-H1]TCU77677.1 hypothetical protein EDE08_103124 [Bradyrhizobium sp. R2.2-H]